MGSGIIYESHKGKGIPIKVNIKVNIKVRVNVKVHRRCVKHLHIANSSLGCNLSAQVSTFCDIKRRPTTKYQVVEALDSNILDVIKVL